MISVDRHLLERCAYTCFFDASGQAIAKLLTLRPGYDVQDAIASSNVFVPQMAMAWAASGSLDAKYATALIEGSKPRNGEAASRLRSLWEIVESANKTRFDRWLSELELGFGGYGSFGNLALVSRYLGLPNVIDLLATDLTLSNDLAFLFARISAEIDEPGLFDRFGSQVIAEMDGETASLLGEHLVTSSSVRCIERSAILESFLRCSDYGLVRTTLDDEPYFADSYLAESYRPQATALALRASLGYSSPLASQLADASLPDCASDGVDYDDLMEWAHRVRHSLDRSEFDEAQPMWMSWLRAFQRATARDAAPSVDRLFQLREILPEFGASWMRLIVASAGQDDMLEELEGRLRAGDASESEAGAESHHALVARRVSLSEVPGDHFSERLFRGLLDELGGDHVTYELVASLARYATDRIDAGWSNWLSVAARAASGSKFDAMPMAELFGKRNAASALKIFLALTDEEAA